MISKSVRKGKGKGKLALVQGAWEVQSNPISRGDLARRLADALTDQRESGSEGESGATPAPSPSSPPSPPSSIRRFRVGGPQVLSFAELAEEAGRALGEGVEVSRVSIPRPLARLLLSAASFLSLFGLKRALAAKRFLSFLWVVGTDESPGSLVGDEKCGSDTLRAFFEGLGEEEKEVEEVERRKMKDDTSHS